MCATKRCTIIAKLNSIFTKSDEFNTTKFTLWLCQNNDSSGIFLQDFMTCISTSYTVIPKRRFYPEDRLHNKIKKDHLSKFYLAGSVYL